MFRFAVPWPGLIRGARVVALIAAASFFDASAARAQTAFETTVRNAILIDVTSESVLFEKAADEPQPPASLAKLMTIAVIFEEMRQGRLSVDREIVISQEAWRRGGAPSRTSSMYAAVNSRVRAQDLIRGAVIVSGNDATIALAEGVSGTEANFVHLMNRRAREIGLTHSTFGNSTGLPHPEQRMSARDAARLAEHIIKTYPADYAVYAEREFTWGGIKQTNRNPLLGGYPGADGLKTGFIEEAGFNLVGSAAQDGQRLIVVVMGARSLQERSNEARKLLDWGFRAFEMRDLFRADETIVTAPVHGGAVEAVPVVAGRPVRVLLPRGVSDQVTGEVTFTGPLKAPIARGAEIGRIKIRRGGQVALDIPAYAGADAPIGALTQRAGAGLRELAVATFRLVAGR